MRIVIRVIKGTIDYITRNCIVLYQKYISPYKGFCCAYRHYTGGYSCSSYALTIVKRYGALGLFRTLPKQFKRCELAYLAVQQEREEEKKKEEGDWCSVDPCDCIPDIPKGCSSKPTDGGADGCGDLNLDCNVFDGCSAPFEACSCSPFGYKKPMWKRLSKKP